MDRDALLNRPFPVIRETYTAKETILYALGVGVGLDPLDTAELPFVDKTKLRLVPGQASVLAFPGAWLAEESLGVNYAKLLHGGQAVIFERALQPEATIRGEYEILGIDDKGAERGAVVFFEKRILDDADGGLICRVRSTYFLRGDGGCGSWGNAETVAPPVPDGRPDRTFDRRTSPNQALIYQLNGDHNPLHVDPAAAEKAGFPRPILHGLSSFGAATFGMVQDLCDGEPDRLAEIAMRFSRPVFPGDTISFELYEEPDCWRFRARVRDRDEVVLDRGLVRLR